MGGPAPDAPDGGAGGDGAAGRARAADRRAGAKLQALQGAGTPAKLLYTIPNFHNPAGVDLSLERRKRVVRAGRALQLRDPGGRRLRGAALLRRVHLPRSTASRPKGRVVRSATLSKILAAGLRVGYLTAPREVIGRLNSLKLDGGASPFVGRIAATWLRQEHDAHVPRLSQVYRRKRDALVDALEQSFPAGDPLRPTWTLPAGGFFLWLKLPPGVDPRKVAEEAGQRGARLRPGQRLLRRRLRERVRAPGLEHAVRGESAGRRRPAGRVDSRRRRVAGLPCSRVEAPAHRKRRDHHERVPARVPAQP